MTIGKYIQMAQKEKKESMGSVFVIRNTAIGYRISINKIYNILTVEACAIAKSLE